MRGLLRRSNVFSMTSRWSGNSSLLCMFFPSLGPVGRGAVAVRRRTTIQRRPDYTTRTRAASEGAPFLAVRIVIFFEKLTYDNPHTRRMWVVTARVEGRG